MGTNLKNLLFLHILLLAFSAISVLSKFAAQYDFLSWQFCLLYAGVLLLLGAYAIAWQQILRRLPLSTAFSNKAITVVWGIIWGAVFFAEGITIGKVIGAVLIIGGIVLFARADADEEGRQGHEQAEGADLQ